MDQRHGWAIDGGRRSCAAPTLNSETRLPTLTSTEDSRINRSHIGGFTLAYEILSAAIQGVCTIIAARFAVKGALAGLENWKREIPGRRRLEVAESCLASAYSVHGEISNYAYKVERFMGDDIRLGVDLPREERQSTAERLWALRESLNTDLNKLRQITTIADVYFGGDLKYASGLMYEYFHSITEQAFAYQRLCDRTLEATKEKELLYSNMRAKFGSDEPKAQAEVRDAPLRAYNNVLKPHLGVHASPGRIDRLFPRTRDK